MRHMLNEERMDWDLPSDGEIGSVLCGGSAVTDTVKDTLSRQHPCQ